MDRTHIGDHDLTALRDWHRTYLFEEYLPFWDRFGIDHELGGFMCALDHDGTRINDDKYVWYQGRGLWVYSHLYRLFGRPEHLEVAHQTRDFLVRHGRDAEGDWAVNLSREGRVLKPAGQRAYAGMFVAEGLQAYGRATGDQEALDLAIQSLWRAFEKLDDPERFYDEGYVPHSYPGQRSQGSHMVAILILTQLLEQVQDARLSALADRVVDAIVNRFWNPEYRLNNEALAHDYTRPDDANEDFVYLGHAIETLWMLMVEAMRRRDRSLFDLAAERFRRHVEVAWDDVYGGVFHAAHINGAFKLDKVLWAQEEVLVGCGLLMAHTNLDWPWVWYSRMYDYIEARFSLKPHGFPLYLGGGDRKVTFTPHVARKENYHHPRRIMHSLTALDGLVERGGAPSGFWED